MNLTQIKDALLALRPGSEERTPAHRSGLTRGKAALDVWDSPARATWKRRQQTSRWALQLPDELLLKIAKEADPKVYDMMRLTCLAWHDKLTYDGALAKQLRRHRPLEPVPEKLDAQIQVHHRLANSYSAFLEGRCVIRRVGARGIEPLWVGRDLMLYRNGKVLQLWSTSDGRAPVRKWKYDPPQLMKVRACSSDNGLRVLAFTYQEGMQQTGKHLTCFRFDGVKPPVITVPHEHVLACAVSPDGARAVFSTSPSLSAGDGTVVLWDLNTGATKTLHTAMYARAFGFSEDGRQLAACAFRGLFLWDLMHSSRPYALSLYSEYLAGGFAPSGEWLVSIGDYEVTLWDIRQKPYSRCELDRRVRRATFSPDSTMLAYSLGNEFEVRSNLGQPTQKCQLLDSGERSGINSLDFAPAGLQRLIVTGKRINLFALQSNGKLERVGEEGKIAAFNDFSDALFTRDGRDIVASPDDETESRLFNLTFR